MIKNLGLFFLLILCTGLQAQTIKGTVRDDEGNLMPFVAIGVDNTTRGTQSDIDGKFILRLPEDFTGVRFSFIGHIPKHFTREEIMAMMKEDVAEMNVVLIRQSTVIQEVVITPGMNPAHRIIRKVIENRDRNNPEKMRSFSYNSYNKLYVTTDFKGAPDTTNSLDTARAKKKSAAAFFEKQHLFLMESVSERKFMFPDRNNEKVIGSRISGLQSPLFTALGTQLQSFSFYSETITILEKKYMNPVSKGTFRFYHFTLEDTLYDGRDSIFIISFRPRKDKDFEAMKGVLYINTNSYAVQNIIAEPRDLSGVMSIKIQQQYQYFENKQWFPVQLNTDVYYNLFSVTDTSLTVGNKPSDTTLTNKIKVVSRSYLSNITLDPEFKKKEFDPVEIEVLDDASKKDETFWSQYRVDSLTKKDSATYHVIDSIGKKENFERKLQMVSILISGKIPMNKFNLDLKHVLNYNEHEGFRIGAGIHTSSRFSKRFMIGGYAAYGFKDKEEKYGGDILYRAGRFRNIHFGASYEKDVMESGASGIPGSKTVFSNESFRKYYIRLMDSYKKEEAFVSFRALKYFHFTFSGNRQLREVTPDNSYRYGVPMESITPMFGKFRSTEASLLVNFIYKEKFMRVLQQEISLGSKYPSLTVRFTKGFEDLLEGTLNYSKIEFKTGKSIEWKRKWGSTNFEVSGGFAEGELPYSYLFTGKASYKQYGLTIDNSFETMRFNEFLSDRFVQIFLRHHFKTFFKRTSKFNPAFSLAFNAGAGDLSTENAHHNLMFNTMKKGYYEGGILMRNILNAQFTGIGIGAFYRFGPYSLPQEEDNLAIKISIDFRF